MKDTYGNSVSTHSRAALDSFDAACALIRLYRGDPIAALDSALEYDPDFAMAWAVRATVLVQQMDAVYLDEAQRSLRAGLAVAADDAARAHLDAARAWAEGRFEDAVLKYARIARDNPRDLIALQTAHVGCFYLGRQSELRDWPLQALRAYTPKDEGYHAVMGMAAFGLEECGDFGRAEAYGKAAAAIEPRDGWAVHAVAHVHEMRGDLDAGIPWLRDNAENWAPESGFAYHNWWHLALLHMDRGDARMALQLYDEKVRPAPDAPVLLEWIDASALLWRLRLEGVDVGDRWTPLAECWTRMIDDGLYAFNDVHALMAFIGAGRAGEVARTIESLQRAAQRGGDNGVMARAVGLPLAEAFSAFELGRFETCVEKILAVRGVAQRFGGSHAQRDILTLTALHAALRGGMKACAEALAAERLMHKPMSPWARDLAAQAQGLAERRAA